MQPLINLKQFLALLILLIVPLAILTAYFRNFQPESEQGEGESASGHHHGGKQSAPKGWQCPNSWQCPKAEAGQSGGKGEMDHSKMNGMLGEDGVQPEPEAGEPKPNDTDIEAPSSDDRSSGEAAPEPQHASGGHVHDH